jgi:V8-like Glu-specific endopeptidase
MKRLLIVLCLLLLEGCEATISSSMGIKGERLPPCPGTFNEDTWTGCSGKITLSHGGKYVGEYKDGKMHGYGSRHYRTDNWVYKKYKGAKYVGELKNNTNHGQGIMIYNDGSVEEGIWQNDEFKYARKTPPSNTKPKPPVVAKVTPKKAKPKPPAQSISASGFFVSRLGHVITNEHVVRNCKSVTVGDNANKQSPANVEEKDKRKDLALLKLSTLTMASAETKSLIEKLGIRVVPLASDGLLRSKDVELGEKIMVSGYPYGDIFSNAIKVTGGMVSAVRGMGDDSSQFTMDAAVQKGSSGGPIYDENGNVVGVVVAKLDRAKVAKRIGSMPENMNFGIKASTVRQFLNASGLPTKWSKRSRSMSTRELAKIAKSQTVMVVCHR